ncbi:MAG TPA: hypothetical protein VGG12_05405 [Methylovirgula sp.]|jgi:hypothetical protein
MTASDLASESGRMEKYKKLSWYVALVAGAILIPTWLYVSYIQHDFLSRPKAPQPQMGWTTPLPTKGGAVYVTATEKLTLTWLLRLDLALFGVVAFCMFFAAGPLTRPRS